MNTGCFSNRHPVNPGIPTYIRELQSNGIKTAMIGKFHHHVHTLEADFIANEKDIHELGFEYVHQTSGKQGCGLIWCECRYASFLREQGLLTEYREWMGKIRIKPGSMKPDEAWKWDDELTQDAYITSRTCEYIRNTNETPFYLHIGLVGPHPPFDAPRRYRELYGEGLNQSQTGGEYPDVQRWMAYVACITEVDEMVGRIINALSERGILDDTIIIYTSDHGDCAGDNGLWGKINFYEGAVHVPLIVAGPGVGKGRIVKALAELLDIGKTVCDFMNCTSHFLAQGKSMAPLLTGMVDSHRDDVFCEMGSDKMLYDGRYKLMYGDVTKDTRERFLRSPYNGPGFGRPVNLPPDRISLYDMVNDPAESVNLAYEPGYEHVVSEMKEKLLRRIICNMQPAPEDNMSVL